MTEEEIRTYDRTAAFVSLGAIKNNYEAVRRRFPGQKVMSILKADAYGHGISGITPVCEKYTDMYAVATVEEGERIRKAGGTKPVLLLGPCPEGRIREAAELHLTFSVGSIFYAMKLETVLGGYGLQADCHLKIDTGFHRTGFVFSETGDEDGVRRADSFSPTESDMSLEQIFMIYRMRHLKVKGIYTHLPVPESDFPEDMDFTRLQICRFREAEGRIKKAGFDPGITHVFSTGGALFWSSRGRENLVADFDMIRVGMLIYGQCDTLENYRKLGLKQAMRWVSSVVAVKEIDPGETVGYGRMFTAPCPTLVGTVSCGYADGYRRNYQGLSVLCGGKRVPVIGRICMDFLMIDLNSLPEAGPGMEVVLLGFQEGDGETAEITAIEIAEQRESTCGEVTAAVNWRVPRYYIEEEACWRKRNESGHADQKCASV